MFKQKTPEQMAALPEKRKARIQKRNERFRRGQLRVLRTGSGMFYNIAITKDCQVIDTKDPRNKGPLAGAKASVATEGEIRERFTATRIFLLGIFALAFKKKTSDKDLFFIVEGDGYGIIAGPLKNVKEMEARRYAQQFNLMADDVEKNGVPV